MLIKPDGRLMKLWSSGCGNPAFISQNSSAKILWGLKDTFEAAINFNKSDMICTYLALNISWKYIILSVG